MSHSLSLDVADALRISALEKRTRLVLLSEKYGVASMEPAALDRTGLMRIADTFDFLSNNLPPGALAK